ncbi:MAG TPA: GNAT family N-acetyltransferase [Chthoniobacterales bacterium]|nr:GNAT family N-acetyltransferase [Chthoniobacterales bacterium]
MAANELTTARLRLAPHAPRDLRALIQGQECYELSSGLKPADGLRDFIVSPDVSPDWLAELGNASEPDPWRYGFALIPLDSATVIGNAGFTGPPDANGIAEIAYGVVPAFQGCGYATEAAQALAAYAGADSRVRTLWAHTLPERNASCRVLEKCGFQRVSEINHPTDGLIWRWERRVPANE